MSLSSEHPTRWPLEVSVTKKGDKITLHDVRYYEQSKAKLPDGEYVLLLAPVTATRALKANNAYHGDLATISQYKLDAGYPAPECRPDALHTMYKTLFNNGNSTAGLEGEDFATYHNRVCEHAAHEWGVEFTNRRALALQGA